MNEVTNSFAQGHKSGRTKASTFQSPAPRLVHAYLHLTMNEKNLTTCL